MKKSKWIWMCIWEEVKVLFIPQELKNVEMIAYIPYSILPSPSPSLFHLLSGGKEEKGV